MIQVHTDGSIQEKNPGGVACWGWIAFEDVATPLSKPYLERIRIGYGYGIACEGEGATSNVAEYQAVIEALTWLAEHCPGSRIMIVSDSQLVVYQLTGKYGVSKEHLKALRDRVRGMMSKFAEVRFTWVPREQNTQADELSRRAYLERKAG